jgi:hypothetical protein
MRMMMMMMMMVIIIIQFNTSLLMCRINRQIITIIIIIIRIHSFIWPGLLRLVPGSVADGATELVLGVESRRGKMLSGVLNFGAGLCRGKE